MANDTTPLQSASDAEKARVLDKLMETGQVSAEVVNSEIMAIRGETAGQANAIAEATENTEDTLTPEQVEEYLGIQEKRFRKLQQLHEGIQWNDVVAALRADPEAIKKLHEIDQFGHQMTVFEEENGEFVFASAWNNVKKVDESHRDIVFYQVAERFLKDQDPTESFNGNAKDIVKKLGADLANPKYDEQLRKAVQVNGWAWLKTELALQKRGFGTCGLDTGIHKEVAETHESFGSFRAEVRVKKV